MGKLFETGWQRKPRGPDGKLLHAPAAEEEEEEKAKPAADQVKAKDGMETVKVTKTVGSEAKREETGSGTETSELAKMQTATDGPAAAGQVVLEGTRVPEI